MGIPAGPGSYVRDFAAMYRFEDGKIAERWVVRDDLGMFEATGSDRRPIWLNRVGGISPAVSVTTDTRRMDAPWRSLYCDLRDWLYDWA